MAEWFIVLGLILFGLLLIIVEIVFVPGTTVVGILGGIFGLVGLSLSFNYFGNTIGFIVSLASLALATSAIILSLKSSAWERFSLKSVMSSRVNEDSEESVSVGDTGKAISTIKPIGNGLFGETIVEVRSNGDYIAADTEIRISKITDSKIFVESISNI